jgi:acetyl-CoA carboxylase carboxyl transferase subunit alpha
MLQYSTYSVISPEGCASILWKSAEKAPLAAEAMGVGASQIKELGLINNIVDEPLGGGHRDHDGMAANLKATIKQQLAQLQSLSMDDLLEQRYQRLMSFGYC